MLAAVLKRAGMIVQIKELGVAVIIAALMF
jgi:hypothetical protein